MGNDSLSCADSSVSLIIARKAYLLEICERAWIGKLSDNFIKIKSILEFNHSAIQKFSEISDTLKLERAEAN